MFLKEKSLRAKIWFLSGFTILSILALFFIPPVSQEPGYHRFADPRMLLGIPNFWNVVSNIPFLATGIYGLYLFYSDPGKNIQGFTIAAGAILIAAGSAYYHYQPSNYSLVWDRIPMTVVFMGFLSFLITSRVHEKAGKIILIPLILAGAGSVMYWYFTQSYTEAGDLRFYGWVQFYPIIITLFIFYLFPKKDFVKNHLLKALAWYAAAKTGEHFDWEIFSPANLISGHTLKHFFASVSVWHIIKAIYFPPAK